MDFYLFGFTLELATTANVYKVFFRILSFKFASNVLNKKLPPGRPLSATCIREERGCSTGLRNDFGEVRWRRGKSLDGIRESGREAGTFFREKGPRAPSVGSTTTHGIRHKDATDQMISLLGRIHLFPISKFRTDVLSLLGYHSILMEIQFYFTTSSQGTQDQRRNNAVELGIFLVYGYKKYSAYLVYRLRRMRTLF